MQQSLLPPEIVLYSVGGWGGVEGRLKPDFFLTCPQVILLGYISSVVNLPEIHLPEIQRGKVAVWG